MTTQQKPAWTRSLITFLIVFALAGFLVLQSRGCRQPVTSGRPSEARVVPVRIGRWLVKAEVADTPELRQRGLQARADLEPGYGMLFVFPEPCEPSFWMKDTAVPLSIAFMRDDGTIVRIARMEPNDLQLISPGEPVRYALEVRQGWFEDRRIVPGIRAELPREIPPPPSPASAAKQ